LLPNATNGRNSLILKKGPFIEEIRSEIMIRFLSFLASTVLFALIYAWIYMTSYQLGGYSPRFSEGFIIAIFYAGAIYFIGGLPLSIFLDKLIKKYKTKASLLRYFAGLVLYSLAGILVGFVFLVISGADRDLYFDVVISVSIFGLIAANIYYHLSLLIFKTIKN